MKRTVIILGHCPDLTDPDAESVPIGVVVVQSMNNTTECSLYLFDPLPECIDPFTQQILTSSLPRRLESLGHEPSLADPADRILELFRRGNLHVMSKT